MKRAERQDAERGVGVVGHVERVRQRKRSVRFGHGVVDAPFEEAERAQDALRELDRPRRAQRFRFSLRGGKCRFGIVEPVEYSQHAVVPKPRHALLQFRSAGLGFRNGAVDETSRLVVVTARTLDQRQPDPAG